MRVLFSILLMSFKKNMIHIDYYKYINLLPKNSKISIYWPICTRGLKTRGKFYFLAICTNSKAHICNYYFIEQLIDKVLKCLEKHYIFIILGIIVLIKLNNSEILSIQYFAFAIFLSCGSIFHIACCSIK